MVSLTWPQILGFRLRRQHLLKRAHKSRLVQVVRDTCGIQAQVMSAAELALWARIDGLTRRDVADALWKRRSLVKTWCMRGALHLLPAEDFGVWVGILSTRRSHERPSWLRYFGLTRESLQQVMDGVTEALDGTILTREELAAEIARHMGPGVRRKLLSGWGSVFKPPAYQGRLCFGPSRGQNITFVRPDQWIGEWDEVDAPTATREMVRRYLRTYGPSTVGDFALWWGGGDRREMKSAFRELGAEIEIEGHAAWALREDIPTLRRQAPADVVRLLPHFDMYTYGFRPRTHFVPDRFAARVFREAGWISPVILINGIAAGTWEWRRVGRTVDVRVQPFAPLRRQFTKQIAEEADRLGAFLDAPVRVVG